MYTYIYIYRNSSAHQVVGPPVLGGRQPVARPPEQPNQLLR